MRSGDESSAPAKLKYSKEKRMSPVRNAPSNATGTLGKKLEETTAMINSPKFKALIKSLDASVPEQQKAMKDVDACLKEHGIPLPNGVSFSFNPKSALLTLKIEVPAK
jgi:hypothetical protein